MCEKARQLGYIDYTRYRVESVKYDILSGSSLLMSAADNPNAMTLQLLAPPAQHKPIRYQLIILQNLNCILT